MNGETMENEDEHLAALLREKLRMSIDISEFHEVDLNSSNLTGAEFPGNCNSNVSLHHVHADQIQKQNVEVASLTRIYQRHLEEMHEAFSKEIEKVRLENQVLKTGFKNATNEANRYKCLAENLGNKITELEKTLQETKFKNYVLSVHLKQAMA
mmetsp:Transcript_8992/g.11284  ORF Transcript_8992/g.11284 Transcript_8992/m.11284 type:complete len:154 (-) Transcript_8992:1345-1806(-)